MSLILDGGTALRAKHYDSTTRSPDKIDPVFKDYPVKDKNDAIFLWANPELSINHCMGVENNKTNVRLCSLGQASASNPPFPFLYHWAV